MEFETLILDATVVDGTGSPGYTADVGLDAGRIAAIGSLAGAAASWRLDAAGLVLAPGFIDMHTHSDVTLLDDPGGESEVHQGVTTDVVGNCGFSSFPAGRLDAQGLQAALGSIVASRHRWEWTDLQGWAESLESHGISMNVVPLVGHATLRVAVSAVQESPPTSDQLREMQRLAAEAVEQGAYGLSTGLTLPPSSYADTDEVVALAQGIASYPGVFYATHARLWAGAHLQAVEEAVTVGRQAVLPAHYAHMAIIDSRVFGHGEEIVGILERATDVDVTFDIYPYTAAGTPLSQLIPGWAQAGGVPAMLERLRDPVQRQHAREETAQGWFGGLPWEWDKLVISSVQSQHNQPLVGRSLSQIADLRASEPAEALLTLIDEEENQVAAVMHNRQEQDMRFFLRQPQAIIGSDGRAISPTGPWAATKPHPRFYGTYPRILGRYVREEGVLDLETAIYKMTGFPAQRLGLKERGHIAEGLVADLVLFDPQTVIDRATFEKPHQYPVGIPYVFVDGKAVVRAGEHTQARPGRVLRRGACV